MTATMTADELASTLGVSRDSIYDAVRRGDCPVTPIKVGRRLVWSRARVEQLLGEVNS